MPKKTIIALSLLTLIVISLGFTDHLTLSQLKQHQHALQLWIDGRPVTATLSFFLTYLLVAALSLPGAALLTLAAGALFGHVMGFILVSFASTLGATAAFLLSRYFFKDVIQRRYHSQLQTINRGMEQEGAFYLLTLRLVPIMPFFVINLLMSITPLRTATFYWVSQLGMLPGTLVYVHAGTALGAIEAVGDIFSSTLLIAFTLIGLLPLVAKRVINALQQRRQWAHFERPQQFDRNLVVIGAGAGGLVSAYIAAAVNAKVTLVEQSKMGGDCLNTGCVPSKALIQSSKVAHLIAQADQFGLKATAAKPDFAAIMKRVKEKIAAIEPHDSVERYTQLGVEVIQGQAKLIDPWRIEITLSDGSRQQLTTRATILATGAEPMVPEVEGIEDSRYLTSDTLWAHLCTLTDIPERIALLGGGPIGCELAQALNRLGAKVTLIEQSERLLLREAPEASALITQTLSQEGVQILTQHRLIRCEPNQLVLANTSSNPAAEQTMIPYDCFICAIGRKPRLEGLGLEVFSKKSKKSKKDIHKTPTTLSVNEHLQCLAPNLYAVGDLIGPYRLTHAASHQAWYASVNALFGQFRRFKVDYRVMPSAIFTDPCVARVGLTEAEAIEQQIPYEVTRFDLSELDRAIVDDQTDGFIQLLTRRNSDKLLGVTLVGAQADGLLVQYVTAMKHGIGLNKLLSTIHAYPTMGESSKYAAGVWKRARVSPRLMRLLAAYHAWRLG